MPIKYLPIIKVSKWHLSYEKIVTQKGWVTMLRLGVGYCFGSVFGKCLRSPISKRYSCFLDFTLFSDCPSPPKNCRLPKRMFNKLTSWRICSFYHPDCSSLISVGLWSDLNAKPSQQSSSWVLLVGSLSPCWRSLTQLSVSSLLWAVALCHRWSYGNNI